MQKISERKDRVLTVLDEEIAKLEKKLQKVQPLIDELAQLHRSRATLLSEKSLTGSVGSNTRLTQESVIHHFRSIDNAWQKPEQIADALGVPNATVRSHLNRGKNTTYVHDPAQGWCLTEGKEDDDE